MDEQQEIDDLNRSMTFTAGQRFWEAARVYAEARQMGEVATNFAIDQRCPGCHGGAPGRAVGPVWPQTPPGPKLRSPLL